MSHKHCYVKFLPKLCVRMLFLEIDDGFQPFFEYCIIVTQCGANLVKHASLVRQFTVVGA